MKDFAYSTKTSAAGGIFSEAERFHAVVGLAELFNIHGACNAEVLLSGKTEHIARGDENMRALEQLLAEFTCRKSRLFHAREKIERALRPNEAQVRDFFQPIGGVENALAVGFDVALADAHPVV